MLNVSLQDYAITQIFDSLPYGFHELNGGGLFELNYNPAAAFPANGSLGTEFDVVAESVPRDICNKLPTSIPQPAGSVGFVLEDPPETWVNAGSLGSILIYPHIFVANYSELPGAAPGELVTYTIVLTNYTSNVYTNLLITDTLPAGFTFVGMLPGQPVPAPQVNGTTLVWSGVPLAPDGALQFRFSAISFAYHR